MLPTDYRNSCAHGACEAPTIWRRTTRIGHDLFTYDFFCEAHAEAEDNFAPHKTRNSAVPIMWAWLAQAKHDGCMEVWIARSGDPVVMFADKPFSVAAFMEQARAAGHDALGIANDPEAIAALDAAKNTTSLDAARKARELVNMPVHEPINHHTREPYQPTYAEVVSGTYALGDLQVPYSVKLTPLAPGDVQFTLTIHDRICGQMPFDNLVKAATRIDPDHAVGSEKQIQTLRREVAEARAEMYDWRARAEQLEAKLQAYQEASKA
jgi:hypothetical protein